MSCDRQVEEQVSTTERVFSGPSVSDRRGGGEDHEDEEDSESQPAGV